MEKRESIVAVLCVFKYVGTDLRGIFTLFCQKEKKKKLKSANPLLPYFVSLSTSAGAKMLKCQKKSFRGCLRSLQSTGIILQQEQKNPFWPKAIGLLSQRLAGAVQRTYKCKKCHINAAWGGSDPSKICAICRSFRPRMKECIEKTGKKSPIFSCFF